MGLVGRRALVESLGAIESVGVGPMGAIRGRCLDIQSTAMSKRLARHAVALAGLAMALAATPISAASPAPPRRADALHEQALDAVRAVDLRFAGLPDVDVVWREASEGSDWGRLTSESWIGVLKTFGEGFRFSAGADDWTDADTGLGLFVEVMLVADCATSENGDAFPFVDSLSEGDPCASRQTWVYRVLPDGEAMLVGEGEWPDTGAP